MDVTVNYLIFSSKNKYFKACYFVEHRCSIYEMKTIGPTDSEYVLFNKSIIILNDHSE